MPKTLVRGASGTLTLSGYQLRPPPQPGTLREPPGQIWVPTRLMPALRRVVELLDLPPNWDSYGASRVQKTAVEHALVFLVALQWQGPPPRVSPTTSGGVLLAWSDGDDGVEIWIDPDETVVVVFDVGGVIREAEVGPLTEPLLVEALAWAAHR
jgi:hypothetical protein